MFRRSISPLLMSVAVSWVCGCSDSITGNSQQRAPSADGPSSQPLADNDQGGDDAGFNFPSVAIDGSADAFLASSDGSTTDGQVPDAAASMGPSAGTDPFGVRKIYETAQGGEEFFVKMDDPLGDPRFDAQQVIEPVDMDGKAIGSTGAGPIDAYRVGVEDRDVRMAVFHSPNGRGAYGWPGTTRTNWRNIEMTGYIYLESLETNSSPDSGWFSFVGRTGRHALIPGDSTRTCSAGRERIRCEGSAYHGGLRSDGWVDWRKELWHSVYSDPQDLHAASGAVPLLNRWVGLKLVVYNTGGSGSTATQVVVQQWVDWNATKTDWVKVTDQTDKPGQVRVNVSDTIFACPKCNRHDGTDALNAELLRPDDVVSWGGPKVGFWSDGAVWRFKYLSVREIKAP